MKREPIHWTEAAQRLGLTRRELVAMIRDARPTARRPIAHFYLEGPIVVTEVFDS
jgi:hypothetical protein